MSNDRRIDTIEFPAKSLAATKKFYAAAFGWKFTDYGPGYSSFDDGRLTGGFRTDQKVRRGGPLVVLFAKDLEATEKRVKKAGGKITTPAFDFPGGRRFHFADPTGNELAVWAKR